MDRFQPLNADVVGPTHVNADPDSGAPGARPDAVGYQALIDEVAHLCEQAGLVLDAADSTQVHQAIIALRAAQTLTQHVDVTITAPADGDGLVYQGGAWINGALSTEDPVARKRIALLALFRAMDENKARYGLVDDAYDGLETADGIDAGASSNYSWNSAGYVVNRAGETLVAGGTTFSSGVSSGDAALCFDGDTATIAVSGNSAGGTLMVGKSYGTAKIITRVKVWADYVSSSGTISVAGSNDGGATWTPLASQAVSGAGPHALDFAIAAAGYERVRVQGSTDNNARFMEIEIYEAPLAAASVVWNAVEAVAEPDGSHGLFLLEDVEVATPVLGTDVSLFLTKDDGATWEAAALAQDGVTAEGYLILSGSIAAMTAAGDKTMRVKIETSDRAEWRIHGVAHQW